MKPFKQYLNEVEKENQLAKSVTRGPKPGQIKRGQIGFLHFKHGVDYDVLQADAHDVAYFGKNVVRLVGRATGAESVAYIDWKTGTVSFNAGDSHDDKKFEKAVKFKAASLYESLHDLEQMEAVTEKYLNEVTISKSSPGAKKIIAALKKNFDIDVNVEKKRTWDEKEERYVYTETIVIEYYEKGEDSEPIGMFTSSDDKSYRFGHVYSKARNHHNKEYTPEQIVADVKAGHYDKQ